MIIVLPITAFSKNEVEVKVSHITDNVAVYRIEGVQSTNVIVFNTDGGLVVIDSELSPAFSQAIRDKIEAAHPNKPIKYLINTHDHGDHTYGNQVFDDAVIIGHERCREEMVKNQGRAGNLGDQMSNIVNSLRTQLENMDEHSDAAEEIRRKIAYYEPVAEGLREDFALTPPEITFSDKLTLDLGNMTFTLLYIGGLAHSYSDILIHCPEQKLLMTGDLFYEKSELYLDSEHFYFLYSEFDTFVYRLMLADKLKEATALFVVLADLFPESYIAFDSLGEVYMRQGDNEKAIEYFNKSLALNPDNRNAKTRIEELKR